MLQNKSLSMLLNSSPMVFTVNKELSNIAKVNHYFLYISEADQELLIKADSTAIHCFNQLVYELINRTIEVNTIDRYRRNITAKIRAKRASEALKASQEVNLDQAYISYSQPTNQAI